MALIIKNACQMPQEGVAPPPADLDMFVSPRKRTPNRTINMDDKGDHAKKEEDDEEEALLPLRSTIPSLFDHERLDNASVFSAEQIMDA